MAQSIVDLPRKIEELEPEDKELFHRIFEVSENIGRLVVPPSMEGWVKDQFGSLDRVKLQKIIEVFNKITYEGALFNELRSRRPIITQGLDIEAEVDQTRGGTFCQVRTLTPEDTFGRVEGRYSVTASNVAKYDSWHALIIFNEHHPLKWSSEAIADYFDVAQRWFSRVHEEDPTALYPVFAWNCLWRAGASIVHGHAQAIVARGRAYSKIEFLRKQTEAYEKEFGTNYFKDHYHLHEVLGLSLKTNSESVKATLDLCSMQGREVGIMNHVFDAELASVVNRLLTVSRDHLGMQSFNLVFYLPPLDETEEQWKHMPICGYLLDRGSLLDRNADIGAMERMVQEVVQADPYRVIDAINQAL